MSWSTPAVNLRNTIDDVGVFSGVLHRRMYSAWAAVLVLALAGAACSYSPQEPGIFPQSSPPAAPSDPSRAPQPANPGLPVLGDTVWTTAEGLKISLRFAIHAVRRIDGATVLDWSVTPLPSAGLGRGDVVPMWLDPGLARQSGGGVNVFLIDPTARAVYRPLGHKRAELFNHCLCTPLWVAQRYLHVDETRLLQTAFPELPPATGYVDVDLANSLPFWHVPVTPAGAVDVAIHLTDLARPPDVATDAPRRLVFTSGPSGGERLQSITVNRIERSPGFTSLSWTLQSVTDQPEFWLVPYRPPIAAVLPETVHVLDLAAANGPELLVPGSSQPLRARWMSSSFQAPGYYECVCSSLGLWAASLRRAGGSANIVTNFPAVPPGVTSVDVVLPGAGVLRAIPVRAAEDSAARLWRTVPYPVGQWTYDAVNPPAGLAAYDWPTPVPDSSQLKDYRQVVERLTDLSSAASKNAKP